MATKLAPILYDVVHDGPVCISVYLNHHTLMPEFLTQEQVEKALTSFYSACPCSDSP